MVLSGLLALIRGLPDALPDVHKHFEVTEDDIELTGDRVSALNRRLEVTFAKGGRRAETGGLVLHGKGEGLLQAVLLLEDYSLEFPDNAILQKWVEDLTSAAMDAGAEVRTHQLWAHL